MGFVKSDLHIDLLKCPHCKGHNKLLYHCSSCGRRRDEIIIAQPHDWKQDIQLDYRCTKCFSQSIVTDTCRYCDEKMVPQQPSYTTSSDFTARPIVEAYVDGFLVDVYADTGEPVPISIKKSLKNKNKRPDYTKPYEQRVLGRYLNTIFGKAECFVCESKRNLTIHHFVPTSKGGSKNYKENRLTTCRSCHNMIHAKPRLKKNSYNWKKEGN